MTEARRRMKLTLPYAVVVAMALLAVGTVSNQLKINAASDTLRDRALAGQQSLNRQCALVPAGLKVQGDALRRRVISQKDFELFVSTAALYCPRRPQSP